MSDFKLGAMPPMALTQPILQEIYRIGLLRSPSEACGVLIPTPRQRDVASQVVEVPNRSLNHENAYLFDGKDVRLELAEWKKSASEEDQDSLVIWHTHPNGLVGPSVGDLKTRLEGVSYLVVALTPHGPIAAWF